MKSALFLTVFLLAHLSAIAEPILLWPDGAPGALGKDPKDIPTLTPFLADPDKANGSALVILPGGGYGGLAGHEGAGYAEFFRGLGIHCFVLKYRLGSAGYRHPSMLQDVSRAVRLVRSRAPEWKIDTHRVGVIGSSAGGHLASTIATHFDAGKPDATDPIEHESSRPDYVILCYPVITLGPDTHAGSKKNLLGANPPQDLVDNLSNEKQVTKETPPCFVWHTYEDKGVKVTNSLLFAEALAKAGVPFDLHIYEKGGHGMGLGGNRQTGAMHPWTNDVVVWLKARGVIQ